jgi:hypothetical protein
MSALSALTQPTRPGNVQLAPNPARGYTGYSASILARSLPTDSSVPSVSQYYNYSFQRPQQTAKREQRTTVRSGDANLSRTASDANVKYANSAKKRHLVTGPVVIYNVFRLLPVDKQLAASYVFEPDTVSMCKKNSEIAASFDRADLVQTWNLAKLCCEQAQSCEYDQFQSFHFLRRPLVDAIFKHYSSQNDVQTLAMLSCVFSSKPHVALAAPAPPTPVKPPLPMPTPQATTDTSAPLNYNAYHTIHPSDTSLKGWNYTVSKLRRSCSWSGEEPISVSETTELVEVIKDEDNLEKDECLPDSITRIQYDAFKKIYANILYQFGLHSQRACLMKYVETSTQQRHSGLDVVPVCNRCHKVARNSDSVRCSPCNIFTIKCIICRMFVKGLCSVCLLCCHGGHVTHINDWFRTHYECPTGCGCQCLHQPRAAPLTDSCTHTSMP